MSGLDIRISTAEALTPGELVTWRRIQDSQEAFASPFFSPEFTRLIASHRSDVRVAVMEQARRIVGFFPFQRGRFRAGLPVGAGYCDHHGAIVERDVKWDARDVLRAAGLSIWHFDHLLAEQSPFQRFHAMRTVSPIIDASEGLRAYLDGRRRAGHREVAGTQRKARKLERDHGALRFELSSRDPAVFATLLAWKREQYRRTKVVDVLSPPWIQAALEEVKGMNGDNFAGVVSCLHAGDTLVAAHLGLRSRSVWHWWLPAYDPQFARYSPGLVLLLGMIEHAPSMGIATIDLGKGDERYKRSVMTGAIPIATGAATVPSAAAFAWGARRAAWNVARRLRHAIG